MSEELMCRSQTFEAMKAGKIKLEFGNAVQIGIIDVFQRVKELGEQKEELEEDEEILKNYRVTLYVSGSASYDVKAHDEEGAEEKAKEEFNHFEIEWDDIEHVEVDFMGKAEEEKQP